MNADRGSNAFGRDSQGAIQTTDFFSSTWIWLIDCFVEGGTTALEGGHDALDDLCHPVGHVAIGNGYVLYAGWVHSHPLDLGNCRCPDPSDSRPHTSLRTI